MRYRLECENEELIRIARNKDEIAIVVSEIRQVRNLKRKNTVYFHCAQRTISPHRTICCTPQRKLSIGILILVES